VRPYETVIIFAPELEDSVIESFLERLLDLVKVNGGSPGTVDRWGRRTLAYELKHRREGYYVLVQFSAEPKVASELDRFLLLLDEVLRHKIVRLPDKVAGRAPSGAPGRAAGAAAG
jgi:small subunit ribosomal protein S6